MVSLFALGCLTKLDGLPGWTGFIFPERVGWITFLDWMDYCDGLNGLYEGTAWISFMDWMDSLDGLEGLLGWIAWMNWVDCLNGLIKVDERAKQVS